MELTKRIKIKVSFIYLVITCVSNFVASAVPIICSISPLKSSNMKIWIGFLNQNRIFMDQIYIFTFSMPLIFCLIYAFDFVFPQEERSVSAFINLPVVYAFIGMTGWILNFGAEILVLLFARERLKISISRILVNSSMYFFVEALFSFTVSYFLMETIHRKKVLPRYFPHGNLAKYNRTLALSLKFLFVIFYISTVFFPVIYLLFLLAMSDSAKTLMFQKKYLYIFISIIATGIFLFVIIADYFRLPLDKLQDSAQKIKCGDYSERVNIVTSDAFGLLADTFNEMSCSISEKTKKILSIQDSIITGIAIMVESRDNSTGGHVKRTRDCIKVFMDALKKSAEYKNLPDSFCENVIKAAPMHDLGKIAVDDAVLRKPGKFTNEEYELMKRHPTEGARIIEDVLSEVDDEEFKKVAVNMAHYHHERYDGTGYPNKLSGTQIPLEARIMALADVFDALVSKRCYKEIFSYDEAFTIIKDSIGTHFDPTLGKIFISCRKSLEKLYDDIG
jgi:response regulator RpfG family c-di-GMP phosphodiesterase